MNEHFMDGFMKTAQASHETKDSLKGMLAGTLGGAAIAGLKATSGQDFRIRHLAPIAAGLLLGGAFGKLHGQAEDIHSLATKKVEQ